MYTYMYMYGTHTDMHRAHIYMHTQMHMTRHMHSHIHIFKYKTHLTAHIFALTYIDTLYYFTTLHAIIIQTPFFIHRQTPHLPLPPASPILCQTPAEHPDPEHNLCPIFLCL